jgi:hypothetical protein
MKKPSFEASPANLKAVTNERKSPQKEKEVTVPWEFRINKLEKPIVVSTRTIPERFNYWEISKGSHKGGNPELLVGYHTVSETSGERSLGELIPLKSGDENEYVLIKNGSLNPNVMKAVLSSVLEAVKEKGIVIRQVLDAPTGDQRMAA